MVDVLPPIRIIHWSTWFGQRMFNGNDNPMDSRCPPPDDMAFNTTGAESWCTITNSKDNYEDAAAIAYHAVDYRDSPERRIEGQPWILYSQETPYSSPFRSKPESMTEFDFLGSYHINSHFPVPYLTPRMVAVANELLPSNFMKTKRKNSPILWIARNCWATNGRQSYIRELMKYIQVDSYGGCLNNNPFPSDKSRETLMSEYKFYLAIENSNCDHYVTEKLVDTMLNSAVPIVDGPSSYHGFIPSSRSVIRMDAYPDPRELAEYINYLDQNDTAYMQYFSHRTDALTIPAVDRLDSEFLERWGNPTWYGQNTSWCGMCHGIAPIWQARNDPGHQVSIKDLTKEHMLVETTCESPGKWGYAANGPPYIPKWTPSPKDEWTRPIAISVDETVQVEEPLKEVREPLKEVEGSLKELEEPQKEGGLLDISPGSLSNYYTHFMILTSCIGIILLLCFFRKTRRYLLDCHRRR